VTWDLTTDSPLLALRSASTRRARFNLVPQRHPAPLPDEPRLLAGVAEVDLTPPPGLPKAGYSANAHSGTGFRTRLRARILHLRSGTASVVLVQCDLLGGSAVVQHLVARHLADRTDVPLAGVFLGATHTHAGPGQFLGTDFYNRHASNRAGFDPAFTQWLAERIAAGAVDACATRRPARAALGSTDVWGLTRNRSYGPHLRNPDVVDKRTDPQRKYVGVNPQLHLLRVDAEHPDGRTDPLAAMVVFSVHGTGISMKATEYNADLWGYLCGELSHRIEQTHGTRAIVGAVEGTHADVAPALRPGLAGHLEAQRVGRAIGAEAAVHFEALGAALTSDFAVATGLREVDLERDPSIDGVTLPRRPAVGAALVAGAHENLTPVLHRIPPFRPGTRKPWATRHPQGEKWIIGSRWLQPLVLPLRGFPRVLPVQVIRLGDAALIGLPFEVTVESGRRISAAVGRAVDGSGIESVIVSSVANEYSGYVATAEEYALQHYEGGHTLYGPGTEPFLAAHAARLAGEVVTSPGGIVTDVLAERAFDLTARHFLPQPVAEPSVERRFLGAPAFRDPTRVADGLWEARWRDVAPGGLHWHEPMVAVERCPLDGDVWEPARRQGRVVDDQGWDLEVRHLGEASDGDGHDYAVSWFDPELGGTWRHRFVLHANHGRPEVVSHPFD